MLQIFSYLRTFFFQIGVPPGLYDSGYTDYEMAHAIIEGIADPLLTNDSGNTNIRPHVLTDLCQLLAHFL